VIDSKLIFKPSKTHRDSYFPFGYMPIDIQIDYIFCCHLKWMAAPMLGTPSSLSMARSSSSLRSSGAPAHISLGISISSNPSLLATSRQCPPAGPGPSSMLSSLYFRRRRGRGSMPLTARGLAREVLQQNREHLEGDPLAFIVSGPPKCYPLHLLALLLKLSQRVPA